MKQLENNELAAMCAGCGKPVDQEEVYYLCPECMGWSLELGCCFEIVDEPRDQELPDDDRGALA